MTVDNLHPVLVSGCGVSMICHDNLSVMMWCDYIILKGDWPKVIPYAKAA